MAIRGTKKVIKLIGHVIEPDKPTANRMAKATINEMRAVIARGNSPILGKRKFPKYLNPKKYPGRLKPSSPVNLFLSGDFLGSLNSKILKTTIGFGFELGFFNEKSALIEKGHRTGGRKGVNKQPKRPIIPLVGERFSNRVEQAYIEEFEKYILRVIKS